MISLYNLGFGDDDTPNLIAITKKMLDQATIIDVEKGQYFYYSDTSSGVEFWLQVDHGMNLIGLRPHFSGNSRQTVFLVKTVECPDDKFNSAFYTRKPFKNIVDSENSENNDFIFEVPNYATLGNIELPKMAKIQITAFPLSFQCFDDNADFEKNQSTSYDFTLTPMAFFSKKVKKSLVLFAGTIKSVEKRKNGLTGREFYYMLVQTVAGDFDVVVALDLSEKPPIVGGIAFGEFNLSGVILD